MPKDISFSPLSEDYDTDIVAATTRLVKDVPFRLPDLIVPVLCIILVLAVVTIVYKILNLKDPSLKEETDDSHNKDNSRTNNNTNNNNNNSSNSNRSVSSFNFGFRNKDSRKKE